MVDSQIDPKEDSPIQEHGDQFYEEIEAPKFVDFTVPDRSGPDDSSWFCVRIGCDQKHELVDPDALNKSFLLRVMAARSPNIRLRKALSRPAPSALGKCPHSAPAKSFKDRIPRFAMMTSVSQKTQDNKVKVSLMSKFNSTPSNGKREKSTITEKALTTPRHKKCPPNPEPFRSVRNPKVAVAMTKNNTAAKALVFHTPNRTEKTASSKCQTIPTPDICGEMKKLAISSQAKVCKSSRNAAHNPHYSLPTSSTVKSQLCASKLHRNQGKLSSASRGCKGREVPSKYLKKVEKASLQNCNGHMLQGVDNDSSDMEVDGKSRNGSLEACLVSKGCGGSLRDVNSSEAGVANTSEVEFFPSSEESSLKENSLLNSEKNQTANRVIYVIEIMQNSDKDNDIENASSVGVADTAEDESLPSSDDSTRENSLPNTEDLQEKNPIIQTMGVVPEKAYKESAKDSLEENNQTLNGVYETEEPINVADKENVSATDENRDVNVHSQHSESNVGHHKANENPLKVNTSKTSHESATTGGAQGGKFKKAKPTSPKPFRLRTDERGILKEANLERRLQLLTPLKETVPVSNGNLQKKPPPRNEQNGKANGLFRSDGDAQESNRIESDVHKARLQRMRMRPCCKSARNTDSKTVVRTPQIQKFKHGKEVTKEIQNKSPKCPSSQQQLARPGTRVAASPCRLSVIKESPHEDIAAENSTAARSSSRGKRPVTVPKEPTFHRIHVPKSCTKTPWKVIS